MTANFLRQKYERVCFGAALFLALAGTTWWWLQRPAVAALLREPVAVPLVGPAYIAAELPAPNETPADWPQPEPQSHGSEWTYDLFTPPTVYYHETTKSFVVTPPASPGKESRTAELELVEVKRQPYRLQLAGYLGSPGDYVAMFSSPVHAETLLARAGQRLEAFGVSVKSVEVGKVAFRDIDGRSTFDLVARAVLTDQQTGEEVVLDNRSRRYTGKLTAVIRGIGNAAGSSHEVNEGGVWLQGTTRCRIARIQLEPPLVLIERGSDGSDGEILSLTPAGQPGNSVGPSRDVADKFATDSAGRVVAAEKSR